MSQVPLPLAVSNGGNCFAAAYPSTVWQTANCVTPPSLPLLPYRSGTRPAIVGNGNDEVAESPGPLIGSSTGAFESVTGLKSEVDSLYGANNYGLQVNSQFFTTSTPYTGGESTLGWEQFVWINWPHTNSVGFGYIQYWLINYEIKYGSCPNTGPPGGWQSYQGSCYGNSDGVPTPLVAPTNLDGLSLEGIVNSGGNDINMFCISGVGCYSVKDAAQIVDLYQNWKQSEFNVFGVGDGSQANFNFGTTITVTNTLKDQSGNVIVPSCLNAGYTGETNNLNLGSCATNSNQIVFSENYAPQVGSVSSVGSGSVGSVWFVLPDYTAGQGSMTHNSAAKCGGVKVALDTDVYAGTYLFGALTNPQQNEVLDTNPSYVSQALGSCGQPLTSASQPIVPISGPVVNEVVNYYELVEKSSPLYYSQTTQCFTDRATGTCLWYGPGTSTPTKDVFIMEAFTDQAGRTVYIIYGLNWPGTLAAYQYIVNFVLKNSTQYTASWYLYKWTDATSGVSANSIPDPGDTYTPQAQGP